MSKTLIEILIEKAKTQPKRVALPECDAVNTLLAARNILDAGIGKPVLVNDPDIIKTTADKAGISVVDMEIVDITNESLHDELIARYMQEPRLNSEKSYRRKLKNPIYYAMVLESIGDVDCTFCGHTSTTGEVLLAAVDVIGMQEGVECASIFALIEVQGFEGSEGNQIVFSDCGLNPAPSPSELAGIAIATCDNVRALTGWEPRAAFLSFSTLGSGDADSVKQIVEALNIAKERRPDLKMDGEFQLDAAIDPKIAANKVKRESDVAGKANILIFPELNAANIAVKLVQRFAKGKAYGHTLSGFRFPVADSSRGSTVDEMVGDIAMLVITAANQRQ